MPDRISVLISVPAWHSKAPLQSSTNLLSRKADPCCCATKNGGSLEAGTQASVEELGPNQLGQFPGLELERINTMLRHHGSRGSRGCRCGVRPHFEVALHQLRGETAIDDFSCDFDFFLLPVPIFSLSRIMAEVVQILKFSRLKRTELKFCSTISKMVA